VLREIENDARSEAHICTYLRAAVMKLLKAKQVHQATAFKCFLFVALGRDFNKKLRRCGRNGLCQGGRAASRKERAANLGNDLEGVYSPLVPWSPEGAEE
jgi:hypothetical protein